MATNIELRNECLYFDIVVYFTVDGVGAAQQFDNSDMTAFAQVPESSQQRGTTKKVYFTQCPTASAQLCLFIFTTEAHKIQ